MGLFDNINFDPDAKSLGLMQAGANMLNASSNQRNPIGWGNVAGAGMDGAIDGAKLAIAQKAELQQQQAAHAQTLYNAQIKKTWDQADDEEKAKGYHSLAVANRDNPQFNAIPGFDFMSSDDAVKKMGAKAYIESMHSLYNGAMAPPTVSTDPGTGELVGVKGGTSSPILPAGQPRIPQQVSQLAQQTVNQQQQQPPPAIAPSTVPPVAPVQQGVIPNLTGFGGQPQPQPQSPAPQQTMPMPVAPPNFAMQPGETPNAYKGRLAEESKIRDDGRSFQTKQTEKAVDRATAISEGDKQLFLNDDAKRNTLLSTANNLTDINKNLTGYEGDMNSHPRLKPMMDNNVAIETQQRLGTNEHLSNLNQNTMQVLTDTIKDLKSSGISPTQLMNTETEAKRQLDAKSGDGSVASRKEALHKMTRALKLDLMPIEEQRKAASKRMGVEYKPLLDTSILPGTKIYSLNTGKQQIGTTGVINGKKIRVIGPNQVEGVE